MKTLVASLISLSFLFSGSAHAESSTAQQLLNKIAEIQRSNLALQASANMFGTASTLALGNMTIFLANKAGIKVLTDAPEYLMKSAILCYQFSGVLALVGVASYVIIDVFSARASNAGSLTDAYASNPEAFMRQVLMLRAGFRSRRDSDPALGSRGPPAAAGCPRRSG